MPMNPRTLRPSSTFTPKNISGLALWLDAADGSTLFQNSDGTTPATATSDPVGYWRDKSGNSRHATQATAGSRPTIGAQNGRKTLTFDGTDDHLVLGNLSAAFPAAAEIIASYGITSTDNLYVIYQTANNLTSDVFGSDTFCGAFRGTRLTGVNVAGLPSASGAYLWGVASSSSSHDLFVQGAKVLSSAADYSAGTNHAIGTRTADGTATTSLAGRINEVCVFNRVLTSSERQRVNGFLARRWGITLAPQVSNADAQDWVNRVYANGGTVSTSTANAVNSFCDAIDAAGIRDRFARLNLFAGTGLNAALVPLYRSTSFGGSALGNATDTNVGPFVSGDYNETGASGGLTGNGSSKYLNTGLAPADYQANANTGHMSVYHSQPTGSNSNRTLLAVNNSGATRRFWLVSDIFSTAAVSGLYAGTIAANQALASQTGAPAGHRLLSRSATTSLTHYLNAVSVATNNTDATAVNDAISEDFFVLARNDSGSADRFGNSRVLAYSIGDGMTAQQATDFYNAMQTFQTALSRNL